MTAGWYYVSSPSLTCAVRIDARSIIVEGPPIVGKFIGQPSWNLSAWMRAQGPFRWEKL